VNTPTTDAEDTMTVAEKRTKYAELREKALAITDRALVDDRQLTDQEAKELAADVAQAKQLHSEIESARLGADGDLLKSLQEIGRTTPDHGPLLQLKDGEELLERKDGERSHPWAESIVEACKAHGTKAFGMPTGSVPLVSLGTTPVSMGQLGAPLVQAIGLTPWPAVGGRAVQYLRQTGRTNRAAIWAPGSAADGSDTTAKPTSDYTTALVQADVADIAHLASPVKRDDLADFEC
jgi:hypothetical protein